MLKILLAMRVNKWLKCEKHLGKKDFLDAANEIMKGLYEANLGGGVYKKRISNSKNKGKSGGSRLLIAYRDKGNLFSCMHLTKVTRETLAQKKK